MTQPRRFLIHPWSDFFPALLSLLLAVACHAQDPALRLSAKQVRGEGVGDPQANALPGYLLLVVDGSGSMDGDRRWELVRRDLRNEIQSVAGTTPVYIHVIKFGTKSNQPNFQFLRPDGPFLAKSSDELNRIAADITGSVANKGLLGDPYGDTPLYQAMTLAAAEAEQRLSARSVDWASIVIFSDGNDSTGRRSGHTQAKAVQALTEVRANHPESFAASIRPYGSEAERLAADLTRQIPFLKLGAAAPPPPPKPERFEFTIQESSISIGKFPTPRDCSLELVLPADSSKWLRRLEFRLQGQDSPLQVLGTKLIVPIPASPDGRLMKLNVTSVKDDFSKSINLSVSALKLPPNVKAALKLPEDCAAWYCRAGEACGLSVAVDASASPSWLISGKAAPVAGSVLNHLFPQGEHTVKVMATTEDGKSEATVKVIALDPAIKFEVDAATPGSRFDAGRPIRFRISRNSPGLVALPGVKRSLVWSVNGTEQPQWNDSDSIEYRPTDAGSLRVEAKCVLSACGLSQVDASASQTIDVSAVPGIDLVPPPSILRGTAGSITVLVRVAKSVSAVECTFTRDGAAPLPPVRIPVSSTENSLEVPVPVPTELLAAAGSLRVSIRGLERLADGSERGLIPERAADIEIRDPTPEVTLETSTDRCQYDQQLMVVLKVGSQDRSSVKSIRVTKNGQQLVVKDLVTGGAEVQVPLTPVLKDGQRIELVAQCLDGDGKPIGAASTPTVVELTAPEPEIVVLDGKQSFKWDRIDSPPSPRVELKVPNAPPGSVRVKWEVDNAWVTPDPRNEAVATITPQPRSGKEWNVVVKATATLDGLPISPKPLTLGVTVGSIDPSFDLVDTGSGRRPSVINGRIRLRILQTASGPVRLARLNWKRVGPTGFLLSEGSWSIDAQGDVLDLDAATQVGESLEVTPSFFDLNDQEVSGPPAKISVNPAKGYVWGVLLLLTALALCWLTWFIFSGNELWLASYRWRTSADSAYQMHEDFSGSIRLFGPAKFNLMTKQATVQLPGDGPSWVLDHSERSCRFGGNLIDEVELVGQSMNESKGEPRASYRQPEGSVVSTLSVMAPAGQGDHISAEITPSPYEGFIRSIAISVSWCVIIGAWLLISNYFRFI